MEHALVIVILFAGMVASVALKKLTLSGALAGGILGEVIFLGTGWVGLSLLATFFILGTAASSWRRNVKEKTGIAEKNKGRRNAGQVVANAGIAGGLALFAIYNSEASRFCTLMTAAAFSSATADTLSSELGNVYGRKFYNIISFKKDKRGLDGVVSPEGTLFGLAGSVAIALIYAVGFGLSVLVVWIVLAGTVGNIADSILGATMERARLVKNNGVNFLNTLIAAIVCGVLVLLFKTVY
jgi:uncharacterized protein (TIGR00297 family)